MHLDALDFLGVQFSFPLIINPFLYCIAISRLLNFELSHFICISIRAYNIIFDEILHCLWCIILDVYYYKDIINIK